MTLLSRYTQPYQPCHRIGAIVERVDRVCSPYVTVLIRNCFFSVTTSANQSLDYCSRPETVPISSPSKVIRKVFVDPVKFRLTVWTASNSPYLDRRGLYCWICWLLPLSARPSNSSTPTLSPLINSSHPSRKLKLAGACGVTYMSAARPSITAVPAICGFAQPASNNKQTAAIRFFIGHLPVFVRS